ncbi:MAG: hypothetical protein ACW98K_12160 [Candidatus Kariarchaeaceae archaeon]
MGFSFLQVPEDIEHIIGIWESTVVIRGEISNLFYHKLFELEPNLRPLFDSIET